MHIIHTHTQAILILTSFWYPKTCGSDWHSTWIKSADGFDGGDGHRYICIPKSTELYALNLYSFLHVNHTLVKYLNGGGSVKALGMAMPGSNWGIWCWESQSCFRGSPDHPLQLWPLSESGSLAFPLVFQPPNPYSLNSISAYITRDHFRSL